MDAMDRAVVDALRIDGRQSFAELARAVGLSSSAVHERVTKLEASGAISGYRAVVDQRQIGLGVAALIGVQPGEYGRDDDIAAALEAMPEVEACYSVAGEEAFIIMVRLRVSTNCTATSADYAPSAASHEPAPQWYSTRASRRGPFRRLKQLHRRQ